MADKYDIIIQGGQSNAEGCGIGSVKEEFLPDEDILYLTAAKNVVHTPDRVIVTYSEEPFAVEIAKERVIGEEKTGDFSLTFAQAYKENNLLKTGRKILIVRAGIGGTGFQKGNWGLKDQIYLKMLEMVDYALSLNSENRVVAFLWHQGEHDAFEGNKPENYRQQLEAMVADVRTRYGDIPFLAGDFVNEWKAQNLALCEPIVAVIKKVTQTMDKGAFIETGDLPTNNQKTGNGDNIHFCRESLYELGKRYFQAFKNLS